MYTKEASSCADNGVLTTADAVHSGGCLQVRKLHDISIASVLGTLAMVWALLLTAAQLCARDVTQHSETHIVAPMSTDRISQIFVAVLDAVFAFGGQENWVRWCFPMLSVTGKMLRHALNFTFQYLMQSLLPSAERMRGRVYPLRFCCELQLVVRRYLMGMKRTRDFPKAVLYVIAFMTGNIHGLQHSTCLRLMCLCLKGGD